MNNSYYILLDKKYYSKCYFISSMLAIVRQYLYQLCVSQCLGYYYTKLCFYQILNYRLWVTECYCKNQDAVRKMIFVKCSINRLYPHQLNTLNNWIPTFRSIKKFTMMSRQGLMVSNNIVHAFRNAEHSSCLLYTSDAADE